MSRLGDVIGSPVTFAEATRILRYESTKIKEVDAALLCVFDVGSRTELDRTVIVETRDGVVERYWCESGRKRHAQAVVVPDGRSTRSRS